MPSPSADSAPATPTAGRPPVLQRLQAWASATREDLQAWCAQTLVLNGAVAGAAVLVSAMIWGVTGGGPFWPVWLILGFGILLGLQLALARVLTVPDGATRWFLLDAVVLLAAIVLCAALWAGTSDGMFWPVWVILGAIVWLVAHAVIAFHERLLPSDEHRGLQQRIEQLTRTRAGAVDAQASELNRIERDLHDGAQARLVALTMCLGLARAHLDDDPRRAGALIDEARDQARLAIAELRELARGIAPPILLDRGLGAAVGALSTTGAVPIAVHADGEARAPEPVERAAYFVVAEAVANATKHGAPTAIDVTLDRDEDELLVQVRDDGHGGANAQGPGLMGLRARTEALDGVLTVSSPAGGPTTVAARFPCAS